MKFELDDNARIALIIAFLLFAAFSPFIFHEYVIEREVFKPEVFKQEKTKKLNKLIRPTRIVRADTHITILYRPHGFA